MTYYLHADQFFYPQGIRKGGYLEITKGRFGTYLDVLPPDAEVLDYSGYSIGPGLVDTHIHGFAGSDVMDCDVDGLVHTMSEGLLSAGVTSFLPTALTASFETLLTVSQLVGEHHQETTGAKIRGLYFE